MPKDKTIYIKDKEDYRRYREFFNQYFQDNEKEIANMNLPILMDVDREIIKRRVLDRALWEFGKQISNAELCHINYLHQP